MPSTVPKICRPSAIYDDWVVKGFHIHVSGIELAVRPGHRRGMIVLKRVFRSDSEADVEAAMRIAAQNCLSSEDVRVRWIETLGRAMEYLNGYTGELPDLANGRKYEFRRLQKALLVYNQN